jgi:lipopolysaccharide export system protein LptA
MIMHKASFLFAALAVAGLIAPALAQEGGTTVQMTPGLRQDTSAPVEVEADRLAVDQAAGTAVFSGNVRVRQGELRIKAAEATLEYTESGTEVERVVMTGGVTMTNGMDTAQGQKAIYTIATGEVLVTGDVLLTQGATTISGSELVYNLDTGLGVMTGRVQTVFVPGKSAP